MARLLLVLLALFLIAPAQAATYSFGSVVAKADWDFTPNPSGTSRAGLCYMDVNGDGLFSSPEPLYLDVSGYVTGTTFCADGSNRGQVAVDDIRIVAATGGIGSSVTAADPDVSRPFSALAPHFLRFFDADGDGKFKSKDTLYLDLTNLASKQVTVGDIRLTPVGQFPAGSVVATGDADANMPLADIGSGGGFGSDNLVYKAGSAYYVNTDGQPLATTTASTGYNRDYVVEENDVRLNGKAENPLGDFAATSFTVVNATLINQPQAGKWIHLKVTLRNAGKAPASGLVETVLAGQLMDARGTATIAPGKEGSVIITLPAPESHGPSALRVGKDTIVSFEVAPAPDTSPAASTAQVVKQGAPGLPAILLLAPVALVAWLRRSNT